jgi:hypothetical protein
MWAMPSPVTGIQPYYWAYDYTIPENAGVSQFNVYYGIPNSGVTNTVMIGTSATNQATTVTLTGLQRGATYFITITSVSGSLESDFGPFLTFTVPKKPNPPNKTSTAPL